MTARGTTDRDIAALTYLAGRLREETYGCGAWDQRGLEVKVAEFKNQNLAITVEQILRHATDPEAKTPGALHRKFSPPMPSEREPIKRGNPKRGEDCPRHPGQWPDNCAGCATDLRAVTYDGEPPAELTPKRTQGIPAPDGFRAARMARVATTSEESAHE